MKKQLISSIAGLAIIMNTMGFNLTANAEDTTAPETLVYRTSVNTTTQTGWDFSAAMKCYDNGHIHMDIQCEGYTSWSSNIKKIGSVIINDSMISEIDTSGYAGTSSFDRNGFSYSGYTLNYNEDTLVYDLMYASRDSDLLGKTLMKLDFYVKEDYLKTNQIITVFDKEIEIPFGEPYANPYDTINSLNLEINELTRQIAELKQNNGYGDIDGNDMIDGRDASILLTYYAKTSTGYTGTLEEYVESVKETESSGSLMDFFSE